MSTTPVPTDNEIRRDVLAELEWDRQFRLRDVDVSVKNGVVTLAGWVNHCAEAAQAERAAQRVRGTRKVVNDIEVRMADGDARADATLAVEVMRLFRDDVQLRTGPPEVTVSNGWVTLRGEVQWNHMRRAAAVTVSRLPGVRGITNLLTVRPWQKPSAEELKRRIEEALRRNCETDADGISVEIQGNKAILTGTVCGWCEREAAEQTAWFAPGITSVDNSIRVDIQHDRRRAGARASDAS